MIAKQETLDFYLDFLSPFGYLARARVCEIAKRFGIGIAYHPVPIATLKIAAGNTGPSNREIPPKIAYLTEDLQRWAARYGIAMVRELAGADTMAFNKGLMRAIDEGRGDDYVRHAWDCIWRDGLDPGKIASLEELARRMDWTASSLQEFVNSAAADERYRAETSAATARGVFGVPTFMIDGQMWWGNDRLDFLEQYLSSR